MGLKFVKEKEEHKFIILVEDSVKIQSSLDQLQIKCRDKSDFNNCQRGCWVLKMSMSSDEFDGMECRTVIVIEDTKARALKYYYGTCTSSEY